MMRAWNGFGLAHRGYELGFPWGGLVLCLLFAALAILVVVLLVRQARAGRLEGVSKALEIAAERFARGEIDAEAYKAIKAELERKP
jgi:putative membrane protein